MGEHNNSGEEEVEDKTATDTDAEGAKGADDTQNKNAGEGSDDKGADESDNGDAGDGDDDKGGGKDGSKDKTKETDDKNQPNANEEPPARKRTNVDFIIQRKAEKIAKEKNKGNEGNDDNEEDDGIAPEDAEVIDKRVHKILSPIIEKQVADENKAEAETFVATNPHFKPYLDKVLKWAQHPTRQNIPIESIFYEVAGKDLLKIGAKIGKEADDKAKETQGGGGNNRGSQGGGSKPVWEMSTEEFEAEQAKTRNKQAED